MNRDRSWSLASSSTRGAHIGAVDHELFARPVGGREADLVEHALHHGLQPPRADILDARIHLGGDVGDRVDAVIGEFEPHVFGLQQRHDIA